MIRTRVGAIILKNKKILLARDDDLDFFSLPGGAIDKAENFEQALRRELKDELNLDLISFQHYSTYNSLNTRLNIPQKDNNYLVTCENQPSPCSEIAEIKWLTKEEILSKKIPIFSVFVENVFPLLVKDNLL